MFDIKSLVVQVRSAAYLRALPGDMAALRAADDELLSSICDLVEKMPSAVVDAVGMSTYSPKAWWPSPLPVCSSCRHCGTTGGSSAAHARLCTLPFWLLDSHSFSRVFAQLARWLPPDGSLELVADLRDVHCASGLILGPPQQQQVECLRTAGKAFGILAKAKSTIFGASLGAMANTAPGVSTAAVTGTAPAHAIKRWRWWTPKPIGCGCAAGLELVVQVHKMESSLYAEPPSDFGYVALS